MHQRKKREHVCSAAHAAVGTVDILYDLLK